MARRKRLSAEERLRRYKADIAWGKRAMEPFWTEWRRYIEFYQGEQWDDQTGLAPDNAVVVNQLGPIVNTILPSIYTNQPKARAKAMRPQDQDTAPLVEQVLNYEWRRIAVDEELRLAALDMLVIGNGAVVVGYDYAEERVPRSQEDMEADFMQTVALVQALGGGVPPARLGEVYGAQQQALPSPEQGVAAASAPLGGQGPPQAVPAAGGVTQEQGLGAPSGQTQQGLPPSPAAGAPPMTPGVELPENMPPLLRALVEEESGGPPAEDAYDFDGDGDPLHDGIGGLDTGPGQEPIDPALLPTEDEIATMIPDVEWVATSDDIFAERISMFDIVIDPEARKPKEARWIARRVWKTLEEVKEDPQFKNTRDLKGKTRLTQDDFGQPPAPPPPPGMPDVATSAPEWSQRVELWYYYDLRHGKLCVLTEDHDRFLKEEDWSPPFDGPPVVFMRDYVVPDAIWGFGEAKLILQLQIELNRTRTQIINHNRRYNRKILVDERALDSRGRAALESPIDGAVIPIINGADLSKAVLPLPDSPLPADRYQLSNIIEADITQVTGISDYERGAYNNIRRTATEASIIQDSSSLRQQDKLRRVEDAATEVARRIKSLAQTFYDRDRWILVTGNGWQVPIRFNASDIEGEFDVSVDAGSTEPTNQQMRMQDTERLYQLLAGNPVVEQVEITRELLRAHGIQQPDRFINQMAVLQMQMMGQQGLGGAPGLPGAQPGQLGLPAPEEVQGGVVGGAQAAGVPVG